MFDKTSLHGPDAPVSREALRSMSSGIMFMAGFSLLWGAVVLGSLGRVGGIWPTLVIGLVVMGLGVAAVWGLWRARRFSPAAPAARGAPAGAGRWFGRIFTAQGLAIGIAVAVCKVQHRPDLIAPAIALIVGLHFFPLARVFRGVGRYYYWMGTFSCLIALVGFFLVPTTAAWGIYRIQARSAFVATGMSLVVWSVGFYLVGVLASSFSPARR